MVLASLVEQGILGSETPKGPVSLRFPSDAVELLFPRLFAEGKLSLCGQPSNHHAIDEFRKDRTYAKREPF